ncbi:hypothetical protein [Microvirga pakistanensis]|uniref:hypothetical protein n=1 Tax=Microvirga pakistanensis TaxID=1682650 RepID=UPI001069743E|nr:hypothetical protein [Microvirga pakistanensis]
MMVPIKVDLSRSGTNAHPLPSIGIPSLLLIPLVGMNPGVQEGSFTTVVTLLVVSALIKAAVIEIKRLADHPSDADHH